MNLVFFRIPLEGALVPSVAVAWVSVVSLFSNGVFSAAISFKGLNGASGTNMVDSSMDEFSSKSSEGSGSSRSGKSNKVDAV